jgi:hypothetical protein
MQTVQCSIPITGVTNFCSPKFHTSSGANTASSRVALSFQLHLVQKLSMNGAILLRPLCALMAYKNSFTKFKLFLLFYDVMSHAQSPAWFCECRI